MARTRDVEAELNLPPGFRFHPTDEELAVHYLCRKASHQCPPVPIIAEIDLYKYNPWELPEKALFGEKEWYFFTPRDRKYPNGSRPNRAAGSGYWKATGVDKPIIPPGSSKHVAIKKALVFYAGKPPRGVKTNWIMHEYRLSDRKQPSNNNGSLKLDDWVLCRLYNKKSSRDRQLQTKDEEYQSHEQSRDPLEISEETGSQGTSESNADNDSFVELGVNGGAEEYPSQALNGGQMMSSNAARTFELEPYFSEDNLWFPQPNLDNLQSSAAIQMPDLTYQDYNFIGLFSPEFKPYQIDLPPF